MESLSNYIYTILLEPSISAELKSFVNEFHANPTKYDILVDNPQNVQLDFKESYQQMAKRYIDAQTFFKSKNTQLIQFQHQLYELGTFYLHWQAFLPTIQLLGTPEQVKYWENLAFESKILGCYAQTEVGHGSDVQGLQTTAIFDKDSFILNMNTVAAYKFWPGLLGIFATHAVVQARTNVKGQDLGIQTFVVPIRDPKTLNLLEGIEAGDIGPKLGFLRADNGYLGLRNVRIPIKNMLMRYTQINDKGEVSQQSKNAIKYDYGSMLNLRVGLVNVFSMFGLFSNTLAFNQLKHQLVTQSIENNSIMFKLLRSYTVSYSLIIANAQVKGIFNKFQSQLEANDKSVNETLQFVHLYSSQMKSIAGWEAVKTARESLLLAPFGHLNASDLTLIYADSIPYVTYEGDNNVLMQQTAQYLLKQFSKAAHNNGQFTGIAQYFIEYANKKNKKILSLDNQLEIIERLAFNYCQKTMENFQNSILNGHSIQSAWNELNQCELIKASILFGYTNIFKLMQVQIENGDSQLKKIHKLFGLFIILENRTTIVAFNIANISQSQILDTIEETFGPNKLEFLEYLSNGVGMFRQRNFLNINWDKLQLSPKL